MKPLEISEKPNLRASKTFTFVLLLLLHAAATAAIINLPTPLKNKESASYFAHFSGLLLRKKFTFCEENTRKQQSILLQAVIRGDAAAQAT